MNRFRLLLTAAVLCPLVGCEWMKAHGPWKEVNANKGKGELGPVAPEALVSYLNSRADRFQSISHADVQVLATDRSGLVPLNFTLNGWLVASQPRNFRMKVSGGIGGEVDLGSNDQQFWVYAKVPSVAPMFVYASHTDFNEGKARIPGGIPFEPEWVMQAFGMAHFPPTNQYAPVKVDQSARTYTLSWPAVTPAGVSVVKEVVFDGDTAGGTRPQVKKHVIRDTKGNVICFAEIKEAKTVEVADPQTGAPAAVQYPTRVLLRWEQQKFEMDLRVQNAKINQPLTPEDARLRFSRPNVAGVQPIDLAKYESR